MTELIRLTPTEIDRRFAPQHDPSELSASEITAITKAGTIDDLAFPGAGTLNDRYWRDLGNIEDPAPIGRPSGTRPI